MLSSMFTLFECEIFLQKNVSIILDDVSLSLWIQIQKI